MNYKGTMGKRDLRRLPFNLYIEFIKIINSFTPVTSADLYLY